MSYKLPKVYVGCSLTHAPVEYRQGVEAFKAELGSRKICEVLHFLGLGTGSPHDVYKRDIHYCVATCELLVALCDFPSIGLGYELATQVEKWEKPTLIVAHTDSVVTKLILDMRLPHVEVQRYQKMMDVVDMVENSLGKNAERLRQEYPLASLSPRWGK